MVATRLHAEPAVIEGCGHTIPAIGAAYNEPLHSFLTQREQE